MLFEENKAVVRRLAEAMNKKDLTLLDDLIAPDFVDHELKVEDLDSYKKRETMWEKGFPDMHLTIEDITAEGDRVWVRIKVTATHTGEFRGISPTGKKVIVKSFMIWRVVEGKIVERESQVWDFMDLYRQLGIIEFTETGKKLFQQS